MNLHRTRIQGHTQSSRSSESRSCMISQHNEILAVHAFHPPAPGIPNFVQTPSPSLSYSSFLFCFSISLSLVFSNIAGSSNSCSDPGIFDLTLLTTRLIDDCRSVLRRGCCVDVVEAPHVRIDEGYVDEVGDAGMFVCFDRIDRACQMLEGREAALAIFVPPRAGPSTHSTSLISC